MDIDKLREWLVHEMEFTGPVPQNSKLEELCTGTMRDVWSHLITHCKSQEKTRIIKANIAIASRKQNCMKNSMSVTTSQFSLDDGGERDELLSERSFLTSQLHATLAKIERLEKDIRTGEEYKLATLQTKTERENQIRKLRQSHTLLNLYRKQVDGSIAKLNALTAKLSKYCQDIKTKEKMAKAENIITGDGKIETAADREVRKALDKTFCHMQEVLIGASNISRVKLRGELQTILSGFSASSLFTSLLQTVQNQIDKICFQLNNFDLKNEAEGLKLEAEGGQSQALVSFVREEVDSLTKKFLSSHHQLITARKRLAAVETDLEQTFCENSENILDLNELRSSLKTSFQSGYEDKKKKEIEVLELRLQDAEKVREDQEAIVTWTRNSEANVQEMTSLITTLIESKLQAQNKLYAKKTVTEDLIKKIPGLHNSVHSIINKSKDEPQDMMKTFIKIPVSRYSSTVVEGNTGYSLVPTPDLSIYRLSDTLQYPGRRVMNTDLNGIINSNFSIPDLSYKLYELLTSVDSLKEQKKKADNDEEVKSILESVQQHPLTLQKSKMQQEKDFLPLISSTNDKCREGVELCGKVEAALADYHAQYTQVVVGGDTEIQVEARNLAQWQETLRCAILNT